MARGEFIEQAKVHPWVVARFRERLGIGRAGKPPSFSISSLRAMGTGALTEMLERVGVSVDVADFAATADGHVSAWDLSETWDAAPVADSEFVGLAACELWRRLLPERPSLEMLDERMQEGYDAADEGDAGRACDLWMQLWDDLLPDLLPGVNSFDDVDAIFPGLNTLGNWLTDFEIAMLSVALRDRGRARRGIEVYARQAKRFATSPQARRFRREQAEMHYAVGELSEGEALLQALVAEDPDDASAYACLADHLGGTWHGADYQDVDRASRCLEQALTRPVRNAADWDLAGRLDDLRSA